MKGKILFVLSSIFTILLLVIVTAEPSRANSEEKTAGTSNVRKYADVTKHSSPVVIVNFNVSAPSAHSKHPATSSAAKIKAEKIAKSKRHKRPPEVVQRC
jgi:hypothetical protein